MADEKSRCTRCKKGFYIEAKGITSGTTLYLCNNCFKYKETEPVIDNGHFTADFHNPFDEDGDFLYDGWT